MTALKRFLESGKIVNTHGLKGDVKVEPWCDSPEFLCSFKKLYLKSGEQKLRVKSAKVQKTLAILHFDGIDTIEQAEAMRNSVLFIDRNDVSMDDGVYFVQDLIGLSVTDADDGHAYGKVTDVFKTGANDVYEITDENGKKYLIPAIPDVVTEMEIQSGIVKIRPIKGIFDDED